MASKSNELVERLGSIVEPLGFKRIPKTKAFIRLHGDCIFQCVYWYWQPRCEYQCLEWWVESVYTLPKYVFRNYLKYKKMYAFSSTASVSDYIYTEQEYIPILKWRAIQNELDQLSVFREQILPRFDRWTKQVDIFKVNEGLKIAHNKECTRHISEYLSANMFNLCLHIGRMKTATKCYEATLALTKSYIMTSLHFRGYMNEGFIATLQELEESRELLNNPERIPRYLSRCREENLQDYKQLLSGK